MVADDGGFQTGTWYAAGLWLVLLLAVLLVTLPAPRRPPAPLLAAVGLLAAYAAWSYLSIGWAEQKAMAWEGANRTAFYAVVLALLSLWPLRARAAAWVVGAFAVGIAVVGAVELLQALAADDPRAWFLSSRFAQPVGYVNGNTALWTAAFWPCLVLGSRREVAPPLRALLMGAAVLLAGLALMGQSRGWFFSLPIVAIIYLVLSRDRVRALLWLLGAGVAAAATAPLAFDLYDALGDGTGIGAALDSTATAIAVAAAVTALVTFVIAHAERRMPVPRKVVQASGRALRGAVIAAVVFAIVLGLAGVGDVGSRLDTAWSDFKRGAEPDTRGTRFGTALGSNRYDFWRVGLGEFADRPIAGIGADNFQLVYARERRSPEEARYPHSLPVRVLSQTGLVGAALLLGALAAAVATVAVTARRRRAVGSAAAVAGIVSCLYWVVHGGVDWLWEFAGLGATAFALLGIALALRPRTPARAGWRGQALLGSRPAVAAVGVGAMLLCLAFGAPWLSGRLADNAARTWQADSDAAFRDLDRAAALNPLSEQPNLLAGAIALRLGDADRARAEFADALERQPSDHYALLELGMLEANADRPARALELLDDAVRTNPRDDLARTVRRRVQRGRRVNIAAVNRTILERSQSRLDFR
jgi:tetratricopeptide (TPR) repeat protein